MINVQITFNLLNVKKKTMHDHAVYIVKLVHKMTQVICQDASLSTEHSMHLTFVKLEVDFCFGLDTNGLFKKNPPKNQEETMHPMLLEDILKQFKCLTFRNVIYSLQRTRYSFSNILPLVIFCPSYLKEILKYHKKLK